MKIYGLLFFLLFVAQIYGQKQLFPFDDESRYVDNTTPYRELSDEGVQGFHVKYTFSGVWINQHILDSGIFSSFKIDNFSNLQQKGFPALPSHIDLIAIPSGSNPALTITTNPVDVYPNFKVLPASSPIEDISGTLSQTPIPNYTFYSTSSVFPSNTVSIKGIIHLKGLDILMVEVCPIQYNPATKQLFVSKILEYQVDFSPNTTEFVKKNNYSFEYLNQLPDLVINNDYLRQEIDHYISLNINQRTDSSLSYLIFTNNQLKQAAEKLALWKSQLGYRCAVYCDNNWTSAKVRTKISDIYNSSVVRPDYVLFLGDNSMVHPLIIHDSTGNMIATDLYYGCMDGLDDIYPDLSVSRISVISGLQAENAVEKIINYESNPDTTNPSFYNSSCFISSFQQSNAGIANRMYAWSTEASAKFLESINMTVDREYYTDNSTLPLFWENKYFNSGEQIPLSLKKPVFPWDANFSKINSTINNGVNLLFYRGEGFSGGLVSPFYKSTMLLDLYNEKHLPLFVNLSSLGGKFTDNECFVEKIQRMNSGGMIGIFAHNSISYSGYSDALGLSIIDALVGSPALLSNFTGLQTNAFPLAEHKSIKTLGFLHLHSLVKLNEFWGGIPEFQKKTNESFHLFADPSLKVWTSIPIHLNGLYNDTLSCIKDSIVIVKNIVPGSTVTLVNGKDLICTRTALLDTVILRPGKLSVELMIITISKQDYIPLIDTIVVQGNCNYSSFTISSSTVCNNDSVLITNTSSGFISSYLWDFGLNASIQNSQNAGPFYIKYSSPGEKTISLTTIGLNGDLNTYVEKIFVNSECKSKMPVSGNQIISSCDGILTDDGGDQSDYSDNMESSTLISPLGSSYISLQFTAFKTHSNADIISIYDGSSKSDVLIGEFSGNSLPFNGAVFYSNKGSVLIIQKTDANHSESGFELKWQCFSTSNSPIANFSTNDSISCTGSVQFINQSQNVVNAHWDFGDGITSSDINPIHQYQANGLFSVKMIATNSYGVDTVIKSSYINVSLPQNPVAKDSKRCREGALKLTADHTFGGKLYWYDDPNGSNLLFRGDTFITPVLQNSKVYYTSVHTNSSPVYAGMQNNLGTGSYFTNNMINYLYFDSYKDFVLKSVKVYSSLTAYRTFVLLNSSDIVLESKTILIPAGEHRVNLDFDVPLGTNLKLAVNQNNNLYFNDGANSYPFIVDGIVKIKGSNNHINPLGAYYFCYDWEIFYDECVSSLIPVLAEIIDTLKPEISVMVNVTDPEVSFVNNTKYADTYYWTFGDGDFSILKSPIHNYLNNGLYTYCLISSNECGNTIFMDQVLINTNTISSNAGEMDFKIYPNPAHDQLEILFQNSVDEKIKIELFNAIGCKVQSFDYKNFQTYNSLKIDLQNFQSGIYYLKLIGDDGQRIEKILIY